MPNPAEPPSLLLPAARACVAHQIGAGGAIEEVRFEVPDRDPSGLDALGVARAGLAVSPCGRWASMTVGEDALLYRADGEFIHAMTNNVLEIDQPFARSLPVRTAWSPSGRYALHRARYMRSRRSVGSGSRLGVDHWIYDTESGDRERLSLPNGASTWWSEGALRSAVVDDIGVYPLDGSPALSFPRPQGVRISRKRPGGGLLFATDQEIGAIDVDGTLHALAPRDAEFEGALPLGLAVSPSGRAALATLQERGTRLQIVDGARCRPLEGRAFGVRWFDDRTLAVLSEGELAIVDADSGAFERWPLDLWNQAGSYKSPESLDDRNARRRRAAARGLIRRAAPEASALFSQWDGICDLLLSDDPDLQAQAQALLHALDEPAHWRALALASPIRGGALCLFGEDRPSRTSAPLLEAALENPERARGAPLELELSISPLRDLQPLVGAAEGLSKLRISGCSSLESLDGIPSCDSIELGGCVVLRDLEPLRGDARLRSLTLHGALEMTSIDALAELPALEDLVLTAPLKLRDLTPLGRAPSLAELRIDDCDALRDLSSLSSSRSLRALSVAGCRLRSLRGLPSKIERLSLSKLSLPTDMREVETAFHLTQIDLDRCEITSLTDLSYAPALDALTLGDCDRIDSLAPLAGHETLRALSLRRATPGAEEPLRTIALAPLRELPALRSLRVHSVEPIALESLSGLPLTALQFAQIGSPSLAGVSLTALRHLDLEGPLIPAQLPPETLAGLASLGLRGGAAAQFDALALGDLEELDLRGAALTSLSALRGLSNLRRLSLAGCESLEDLSALAGMASLEELDLRECRALEDLSALAGLPRLARLDLSECSRIRDTDPLAALPALRVVGLHSAALPVRTAVRRLGLATESVYKPPEVFLSAWA